MIVGEIVAWLTDPASWQGEDGIWMQVLRHLAYSFAALALACLVAVPLGLWIGHTGKGSVVVVNLAGALRALPSLGLLLLGWVLLAPHLPGDAAFVVPSLIVLAVLAIPPVLSGVYSGIAEVDPAARDAAKGMGMTGMQVLRRVEIPVALPLILSGVRSGLLQIIATATIAAYVSLGGLGRYLIDGLAARDYTQMAGGALLVAGLALLMELVFTLVQKLVVSPGLADQEAR
ncbi:osmoprotectant transport system permease protein [Kytococcus aerolatus]|uniref:Osmoprotectant transport system permease protein n=1 Tax=Kytococcus aerolatus TaxID=592308 RepID=A0A212TI89_9MICO|nr:ABC transporter permease subunit [Kytococcus aerolatus]SNC65546.1 osmoprotectant transport system permease protein [Kytococcus aerolatus]